MRIGPDQLDEFVAESDRRGGPGSAGTKSYWTDFTYEPLFSVDTALDPFSPAYLVQQLALYREISGRDLNQNENEYTHFELKRHIAARNPYDHPDPSLLALHLIRLSYALRLAKQPKGAKLLDMGCGWGLSSELAAYLGYDVLAMDINKEFVELVRARSERLNLSIITCHSSFDHFSTDEKFDIILFYECLHHAVMPWTLIERLAHKLNPGGKIVLSGEPINNIWWPNWGIRLDPLSVYCIRKHGWFESGWSRDFIIACFDRSFLNPEFISNADKDVGPIIVASKDAILNAHWLHRNCAVKGGQLDGQYIVTFAEFGMRFRAPLGVGPKQLVIHSFRPKPVRVAWRINQSQPVTLDLPPGQTKLAIGDVNAGDGIYFNSEVWTPAVEINNNDRRALAFQILGLEGARLAATPRKLAEPLDA